MSSASATVLSRRSVLFAAAAAALLPWDARAAGVCTPRELAQRYDWLVAQRLPVPTSEQRIYAGLAECELVGSREAVREPQYLLVVDSCPTVQAAFLFWRLLPGHYELIGASPASTGNCDRADGIETPCGVFRQAQGAPGALATRVYDFGMQRARRGSNRAFAQLHLQARAARGRSGTLLGRPQTDGSVLLPASLVAFLDRFGVLDAGRTVGAAGGEELPFAGRYMVVVDSERLDRPEWIEG
jgi:hypothetical protein